MTTFADLAKLSPNRQEAFIYELPFAAIVELVQTLPADGKIGQAYARRVALASRWAAAEARWRVNTERGMVVEGMLRAATVEEEAGKIAALRVEAELRRDEDTRLWSERQNLYDETSKSETTIRQIIVRYVALLFTQAGGDRQILAGQVGHMHPLKVKEERDGWLNEIRLLAGTVPAETEELTRLMAGMPERWRQLLLGPR